MKEIDLTENDDRAFLTGRASKGKRVSKFKSHVDTFVAKGAYRQGYELDTAKEAIALRNGIAGYLKSFPEGVRYEVKQKGTQVRLYDLGHPDCPKAFVRDVADYRTLHALRGLTRQKVELTEAAKQARYEGGRRDLEAALNGFVSIAKAEAAAKPVENPVVALKSTEATIAGLQAQLENPELEGERLQQIRERIAKLKSARAEYQAQSFAVDDARAAAKLASVATSFVSREKEVA